MSIAIFLRLRIISFLLVVSILNTNCSSSKRQDQKTFLSQTVVELKQIELDSIFTRQIVCVKKKNKMELSYSFMLPSNSESVACTNLDAENLYAIGYGYCIVRHGCDSINKFLRPIIKDNTNIVYKEGIPIQFQYFNGNTIFRGDSMLYGEYTNFIDIDIAILVYAEHEDIFNKINESLKINVAIDSE